MEVTELEMSEKLILTNEIQAGSRAPALRHGISTRFLRSCSTAASEVAPAEECLKSDRREGRQRPTLIHLLDQAE